MRYLLALLGALALVLIPGTAHAQPLTYISLPGGIDGHWYAHPSYEPDACVALWHEPVDARMVLHRINYAGQVTKTVTDGAANGNNACLAISADTALVRIVIQRDDGIPSWETWDAWRANGWVGQPNGGLCYNCGGFG